MKKLVALMMVLCLALGCAAAFAETAEETMEDVLAQAQTAELDGLTTASVVDYYGVEMSPDELEASINSYNGFFAVATVNEDSTPNIGFFIFSAKVKNGILYLQFGLAENQSRKNMENGSAVTVMYAPLPEEGTYPTVGARLICEKVTDEALLAELMEEMPQKSDLIYEVTFIRPIG